MVVPAAERVVTVMRARRERPLRPRRMRWRPRFESRTGTRFDVPAAALNFALPSLIAGPLRAALAWRRLEEVGNEIVTTPLQPPESAGQATSTVATPDALIPTVCGGIDGGTEFAGGVMTGSMIGGSTSGGSTTGSGGTVSTGSDGAAGL